MISGQIEERFCRQKCIFQVDGEGETIYKKQATLEIEVGESTIYNFAQKFIGKISDVPPLKRVTSC